MIKENKNTMKNLKIEVRNDQVRAFQKECQKLGIRLGRLNWSTYGDFWSVTDFAPIDENEVIQMQSINLRK
jgi:hypothetical protein